MSEAEMDSTTKLDGRELKVTQAPEGVFRTYSNNVAIGATAFDLRILFSEVLEVTDEHILIEQRAQVTMSWLEAKIFANFLLNHIEMYEANNGKLLQPRITDVQRGPVIGRIPSPKEIESPKKDEGK